MKAHELHQLAKKYDGTKTLNQIIEESGLIHICPECGGSGKVTVEVRTPYPKGLPDSGWAHDDSITYKEVDCKLCYAEGYTAVTYRKKMVQDGWESDTGGEN